LFDRGAVKKISFSEGNFLKAMAEQFVRFASRAS